MKHHLLRLVALAAVLVCGAPSVPAQTSAFTYQGRLNDGSGPANGTYDLVFTLQGAANGAAPVGTPVTANATPVSNGLFTVMLDFGAPALDGGVRWLEIAVKTNGAATFATLAPRQALNSTPYAIRAAQASAYSGAVGAGQITGTLAPTLIGAGSITGDKLASGAVISALAASNVNFQAGNTVIGAGNVVSSDVRWSTIAGGGQPGFPNSIGSGSSFIGAGNLNRIGTNSGNSAIGAGYANAILGYGGFIGSGNVNSIQSNALKSVVGGGELNQIGVNADYAAIPGGFGNFVGSDHSFVGGGLNNGVEPNAATSFIGGGSDNAIRVDSYASFLGGGQGNVVLANSSHQVIAGGLNNSIQSLSWASAIGGGRGNTAQGHGATVPGGWSNSATANFTLAAGLQAQANHVGSFVWADSIGTPFRSGSSNQFLVRATGGVGINKTNPATALDVNGTVTATGFSGDGSGLTGVARLAAENTFTGDQTVSSGNLNVLGGQTVTGPLSVGGDQRVQGNVGLGADPSPSSKLLVNGTVTATSFTGNGSGLSGINAASVTSGTLPDARLTQNIPRLDVGNTFSGPVAATGFIGDGSALTGVAKLGGNNSFTGDQTFLGLISAATVNGTTVNATTTMRVDTLGQNNGTFLDPAPRLTFGGTGNASGEGIASKRTAGGNQFGLDFYTGYNARLSIKGNGNVGVGTTDPSHTFTVQNTANEETMRLIGPDLNGSGARLNFGDGDFVYLDEYADDLLRIQATRLGIGRDATANRLEVEGNASKSAAGDWLANSDRRIKQDIQTVESALDTLNRVRLVSFRYTDDYRAAHPSVTDRPYLNVIAQEFAEVFPDHVQSSGEKLPDGSEILQVDTYPLTIYSAAAVQELSRKVEEKDAKIAALEARLEKLERLMEAKGGDR